ncbi:MAG: GNAT family N-acetyltransferase [Eggerthellaceae bacterium]|nr:GNAT family N-acetyltransferase [Eggerthellaceae bacterium]
MGVGGKFTKPEQLAAGSKLENFKSGLPIVDSWAHNHAHMAKKRGTAVVYVSYTADHATPAGFYTLSSHSIERASVGGGWLKRNAPEQVPAVLLGMLGVDARFQGQGLGSALLADAIARSLGIADSLGAKALVVDPASEEARGFYERSGFAPIPGSSRMYLPLKL